MALNTTTLETSLNTKMNATTGSTEGKEFLLLGKAVEALTPTVTVSSVIAEGTTQVARVTTEGTTQVAAVQAAGSGYASLTGSTFTGNVTHNDGVKAIFGTGSDLQIYHDGTDSYIKDAASGNLKVITNGNGIYFQSSGGENLARFVVDGDSALYYNNSNKLATTATGIDVTGELIATSYNETYAAVTSSSNATSVDCHAGNSFSHVLTENTTFTFSNPPASGTGYTMSIEIIQDASASGFTVTWPASVDWPAATAPTLTATASAKDVFVFTTRDGGTTWYGFTAGQALA